MQVDLRPSALTVRQLRPRTLTNVRADIEMTHNRPNANTIPKRPLSSQCGCINERMCIDTHTTTRASRALFLCLKRLSIVLRGTEWRHKDIMMLHTCRSSATSNWLSTGGIHTTASQFYDLKTLFTTIQTSATTPPLLVPLPGRNLCNGTSVPRQRTITARTTPGGRRCFRFSAAGNRRVVMRRKVQS